MAWLAARDGTPRRLHLRRHGRAGCELGQAELGDVRVRLKGEWLRNEAIIEFSEPDDALPDLDNPATKSWVLQQLRELTGLPALHANFERGRGWTVYSIPLGDSAYVRTGWHSTEGDAIVSAYLLAMGPGGES